MKNFINILIMCVLRFVKMTKNNNAIKGKDNNKS